MKRTLLMASIAFIPAVAFAQSSTSLPERPMVLAQAAQPAEQKPDAKKPAKPAKPQAQPQQPKPPAAQPQQAKPAQPPAAAPKQAQPQPPATQPQQRRAQPAQPAQPPAAAQPPKPQAIQPPAQPPKPAAPQNAQPAQPAPQNRTQQTAPAQAPAATTKPAAPAPAADAQKKPAATPQDLRKQRQDSREQKRDDRKDTREQGQDNRQDRRDDRQDARQDRREDRRDDKQDARQERREDRRMDAVRADRKETKEGNRTIIQERDRTIIRQGNRTIVRHDDDTRFRRAGADVRVVRRGNQTQRVITRPNGVRIVTVVDSNGRLVRRSRFVNGREHVLFRNRPSSGFSFIINLPPPVIRIPRERYIVEYRDAPPPLIYDTLIAPPVMPLERAYSLDEVRYNYDVRARMPRIDIDSVNFETGSWDVSPDQADKLAPIAEAMKRAIAANPNEVYMIEGHTDAVGSDDDNLLLSDRRAQAVTEVLTEQFGVPPENMIPQGYGEQNLKVETDGPEVRNRYVSVRRVTPLLAQQQ